MKKKILSGIQPSGKLHLGNYLGAIKQFVESQAQDSYDRYFFIANYHSLTSITDPVVLREWSLDVARSYLALGLDPDKSLLFLQSDVPEVCELAWILTCSAPMGLLQRCTSYKDKVAKGIAANHGLFAYPVLQSADVLVYDSHLVPVGADQSQHIEVCRDLAQKINLIYGEGTLVVPKAQIQKEVAVIPGTDGQKMSKSYHNTIDLFGTKKELKKQVMGIVTDSKGLDDIKNPDTCNVFQLYRFFASKEEIQEMSSRYKAGGYGYGHAKLALFEKLDLFLDPFRERYNYLLNRPDDVMDVLRVCGREARSTARITMERVRKAIGLL